MTEADDPTPAMGANQFDGQVLQARYMGAEIHYQIGSILGPLMVVEPSSRHKPFDRGAKVKISFCAEDCLVFPGAITGG